MVLRGYSNVLIKHPWYCDSAPRPLPDASSATARRLPALDLLHPWALHASAPSAERVQRPAPASSGSATHVWSVECAMERRRWIVRAYICGFQSVSDGGDGGGGGRAVAGAELALLRLTTYLAPLLFWEHELPAYDLAQNLVVGFAVEGGLAAQEDVQNDAS